MSELRFDGRAILVTGGARGIGLAYAHLLAERGARVLIADFGTDLFGSGQDETPAREAVGAIRSAGGTAEYCLCNLAEEAGARGAVDATIAAFGRIDGIVHNAGFTSGGRPFIEETQERLEMQLGVNTRAGYTLAQQAWPLMLAQGFGRIVLTSSTAYYGMGGSVPYCTAKASVIGLMRGLADAATGTGITVNAVAPSAASRMSANLAESPFRTWFLATMRPELVSPVVAALVHEKCTVNGEMFVMAGGRVARTVLAETRGYVNPKLTPEDVRDNMAGLLADTDFAFPRNTSESLAVASRLLGKEGDGQAVEVTARKNDK